MRFASAWRFRIAGHSERLLAWSSETTSVAIPCTRSPELPVSSESNPKRNCPRATYTATPASRMRFNKKHAAIFAGSGNGTRAAFARTEAGAVSAGIVVGVHHHVAGGAHGADDARVLRIVAKFFPQRGNVDID